MNSKGALYIIAAASGTGKTSLAESLVETTDNIKISVSHTTRPIRANEKAGQHYHFVSIEEFEALIEQNAFLEYANVFGHYYGTSRSLVEKELVAGIDIVLDIDWQGARQVREKLESISMFLLPPSNKTLRRRLERRNSDTVEVIEERLDKASSEISHYKEFDYVIINDKFEDALSDLQAIVRSQRLQLKNQEVRHKDLLSELLNKKDYK